MKLNFLDNYNVNNIFRTKYGALKIHPFTELTSVTVILSLGSSVSILETIFFADSEIPVQLEEVIGTFPKNYSMNFVTIIMTD